MHAVTAPRPLRRAEISVAAIQHNVRALRRHTGARVIVVVKANAYGHGAGIVAPAAIAAGAELVAVASLDEAIALRATGFASPILCWLHSERIDYAAALAHRIDLGLSRPQQLSEFAAASVQAETTGHVHLKLDTGLSRNGADPASWETLFATAAAAQRAGALRITGILSHLANAGAAADRAQAASFDLALARIAAHGLRPKLRHLAASAAACHSPELRYDAIRVGLAAYGLNPTADAELPIALRPVMRFASEVVSLRRVDSLLALVPIGYADGMPRALSGNGLTVSICGERAPVVGHIGMDQCVIDVSGCADRVALGTQVVLFGDPARNEPAVEEWSDRLDTINYEVVAGVGKRVARVAV